jgi:predicted transposase YdaD
LETEVSGSLSSSFAYSYIKRQFATSRSAESESDTTTEKHYVISSMRIERYYSSIKEEVSPLTKDARTLLDDQE